MEKPTGEKVRGARRRHWHAIGHTFATADHSRSGKPDTRQEGTDINTDSGLQKGLDVLKNLFGRAPDAAAINSEFMQVTVTKLFGGIRSRQRSPVEERSLITLATLTARGRVNE